MEAAEIPPDGRVNVTALVVTTPSCETPVASEVIPIPKRILVNFVGTSTVKSVVAKLIVPT